MKKLYDQLQVLESEQQSFSVQERLEAAVRPLLFWYETHARILPWREDPKPYRVWISEIMLQQTRVEAVKPYFERFMEALPTVRTLAEVEEDRLMKLWEGLGYYNRARNLKKAACIIVEEYGGRMPEDYDTLISLPGIGSYTAGAIASIAFGQAVPAVDGNVLRVLSRLLASREDILKPSTKRYMERELAGVMPRDDASYFNQGLIEIGAIVCVPNGQPKCGECPLFSLCLARQNGLTDVIPVKTPPKKRRVEKRTVCLIEHQNKVALLKRADTGLLAALYELPNEEGYFEPEQVCETFGIDDGALEALERLPEEKHIFSHVEWQMIGYRITLKDEIPSRYIIVEKEQVKTDYPLPNAFSRYTKLIN